MKEWVGKQMVDFTVTELKQRVAKLQAYLLEKEVDLVVLNRNSDIYYYSGSVQPLYLVIPQAGVPVALARKAVNRIREEVQHLDFEAFYGTKDLIAILERYNFRSSRRLGMTTDTTSYDTVQRWQELLGHPEVVDLSLEIRMLRLVKSPAEIAIQVRAGKVMSKVPELIKAHFRPGITELALSAAVENYFRLNGHEALIRCHREGIDMGFGVCSAGVNTLAGTKFDGVCSGAGASAAVSYGATNEPIPPAVPVIMDYAFNFRGYHIDQTRMFCWGQPSKEVSRAYEAMLQVEEAIVAELKPGNQWCRIYESAVGLAAELGYEDGFMGLGPEKVRFVGHGVGLELDEPPFLAPKWEYTLAEGMVVAVEPKVSLPGVGVVGIEDTLVITATGGQKITVCPNEFLILD
ncbi:MAG: M24 family metallopeptidase [Bacillota bacterium]